MSRIGKQPISVPSGVTVKVDGATVSVKGKNGELSIVARQEINVAIDGDVVNVTRKNDSRTARALHGLTRSLVNNMVVGVSEGFTKKLEIVGVGYKAIVKGEILNLTLGFSNPIDYKLPKGIKAVVDKQTLIDLSGADKQLVGQVAAEVRSFRPPEPYKGKGIKYVGEIIKRKAGKAGKATAG
ncbi:MAG: 50S ribosomal protein L6 [Deltaproteobacteria bacterium]|nr:50S ribosomal protein L6 [Deltaproteobacteria bacterium]